MELWQAALLFYCTIVCTIILVVWVIRRSI